MRIPVKTKKATTPHALRIWKLRVSDRCDRCGAQAFVEAIVNGVELLFCAHHFRKHENKLREIASSITDEREKLNARPSISANA